MALRQKYNPLAGRFNLVQEEGTSSAALKLLSSLTPGSTLTGPDSFINDSGTGTEALFLVEAGEVYTIPNPITAFDPADPALVQDPDSPFKGLYDPTANDTYPTLADATGGEGSLAAGDYFQIQNPGAFTFAGSPLAIGDKLVVTGPGPLPDGTDWAIERLAPLAQEVNIANGSVTPATDPREIDFGGQDLYLRNIGEFRVHALTHFVAEQGTNANRPFRDSDRVEYDVLGLTSTGQKFQLTRWAFEVLVTTGPPTNGNNISYREGQLTWASDENNLYASTKKSDNPDSGVFGGPASTAGAEFNPRPIGSGARDLRWGEEANLAAIQALPNSRKGWKRRAADTGTIYVEEDGAGTWGVFIDPIENPIVPGGVWDVSTGNFPTVPTDPAGGRFLYIASNAGAGTTIDGVEFNNGDWLLSSVDTPSTTTYAANWEKADGLDPPGAQALTQPQIADRADTTNFGTISGELYNSQHDLRSTRVAVADTGTIVYFDDSWIADGATVNLPAHEEGKSIYVTLDGGATSATITDLLGAGQDLTLSEPRRTRVFTSIGGAWVERNPCQEPDFKPLEPIAASQTLPVTQVNNAFFGYLANSGAAVVDLTYPDNPTDSFEIPIARAGANPVRVLPGANPAGMTVNGGASFALLRNNEKVTAKYNAGANDIVILPSYTPDIIPLWGLAEGVIHAGKARLKPELITLPDSANSTPAPVDGQEVRILTDAGQNWDTWDSSGGAFQTEGSGPTTLPTLGSILGSNNREIVLIYHAGNDAWYFHA